MKKIISIIVFVCIVASGVYYLNSTQKFFSCTEKTLEQTDVYVGFSMEAYDLIVNNYWAESSQYNINEMFRLSLEKVTGKTFVLASSTRNGTVDMLALAFSSSTSTEVKKKLALDTLMVVLYNLQPNGRNGILSLAQEKDLRQDVSNINPEKDLYKDLGIAKGASEEEITKAFEAKNEELKKSNSPEAKAELEKITYAKKVLTNPTNKSLYDTNQVEPTVFSRKIGKTLYLYMPKISPTTFIEFARAVDSASTTPGLDSMILDVRGNVGGSLDFVQNFLGLFKGPNQHAFDLFHQGKYEAIRTVQPKFAELDRFGEVAIITDNMTQSTAEVISATFKRLNMGKTVGATTRGWGTVENTYPINTVIDENTKYSLLLVNSITLRDDNQPIEGRGVDPNVSTGDVNWKIKIKQNFRTPSLIEALSSTAKSAPLK